MSTNGIVFFANDIPGKKTSAVNAAEEVTKYLINGAAESNLSSANKWINSLENKSEKTNVVITTNKNILKIFSKREWKSLDL